MDSKKVVLSGEFDATGVRQGTQEAKQAVRDLATDAAAQGAKAGQGLEKIGEGAQKGAKQAERELSNLQQSIQRATARIESAGQSQAQYFEALARQRGVSVDALQPYLTQLREVESRQTAANAAVNQGATAVQRVGQSAAQTRQALAQLPLQFQDIAVSLQAGQQPLTVLLQQGTQIAGTFGGVGEALRATGGFLAGLITPVNVLGAGIATLAAGFLLGRREISETEKVLILSGQAAGVTGSQIGLLADQLDRVGGTRARATEVLREFAKAGELGAANLQRFAAAAIALERAGGPAAEETAKAFAELAEKPLEASLKLTRSTNFLTVAVLEQITALEQQGRTVEAARVAQEAYAGAIEDRNPKLLENLGLVESAWLAIKNATKEAGDAILSIGRAAGLNEQIAALEQQLARNKELGRGEAVIPGLGSPNQALRERISLLQQAANIEALNAQLLAEQARQVQARGEWDKQGVSLADSRRKLEVEIAQARELGLRANRSEEEIQQRIAAIRARAARSTSTGPSGNRELEAQLRLINELSGVTADYTQDVQRLIAARDSGRITDEQYLDLLQRLIARTPQARAAEKEREDGLKAQAKAAEEVAKANERYLDTLNRAVGAARSSADAAADQLIGLVAGKEALEELRTARIEDTAAELRRKAVITADEQVAELYRAEAAELERLAAIRRRIATANSDAEVKAANDKASKEAGDAWQRVSDQISQSLTDAIIEGGVSGREALERAFKSLVLRPIIQAAVEPLARQITGSLGLPGIPQAGSQGASAIGSFLSSNTASAISTTLIAADAFMSAKAGNWGTAIGTAAGQYLGGPIGAVIGKTIGQGIDKLLRGGAGTPSVGSVVTVNASGARTGGPDPSRILDNFNRDTDAALKLLAGQSVGLLNSLAVSSGATAQFEALAKFTADNNDPSFGEFFLTRDGRGVGDLGGAKKFASDPRAGFEAFATDVAAITRQALADIDLPAFARRQIDALGTDATLDQLTQVGQGIQATITAIGALRTALDPLAGSLGLLADQSSDSLFRLAELSGGFDALGSNVQTFYGAFVSETDRAAAETARITETLGKFGIALPQTRGEFADLVQAQIALGEAGQPALAALLGVAGSFDQLTTRADTLQRSLSDALIGAAERFAPDDVLRLRTDRIRLDLSEAGVQIDLQQLLGASTADIEAFARAFVSTGTASTEAQIAVLNAAGALAALRDSSSGATQILQQRTQLEERLLQLQGNEAELQRRQLAEVTDDYNRALLEQIFALENAAKASSTFSASLQGFFNTPDLQSLRGNNRRLSADASGALFEFDLGDFAQQRAILTEADIPGIVAQYSASDQARANALLEGNPFYSGLLLDQVARTRSFVNNDPAGDARQAQLASLDGNRAGGAGMQGRWQQINRELLSTFGALDKSLREFIDGLDTSEVMGLSPEQMFQTVQEDFFQAARLAQEGSVADARRVQELGQRALELSRTNFGSGEEGTRTRQAIVQALKDVQAVIERLSAQGIEGIKVNARGFAELKDIGELNNDANSDTITQILLNSQRTAGFGS